MRSVYLDAEMSEWFKEHDWKSCDAGMYPEVQILFSAPTKEHTLRCVLFVLPLQSPLHQQKHIQRIPAPLKYNLRCLDHL